MLCAPITWSDAPTGSSGNQDQNTKPIVPAAQYFQGQEEEQLSKECEA